MKTLMICLLMISSVMIIGNVAEVSAGKGKYLDPGVLDRCLGSNPPPECHIPDPKDKTRAPAHDYRHGCLESQHCRPN
ncbi:PREDICTED: protein RALF-like 30 [Brassica oleracea var. oleracea]|uniref:protein RALF-like 30 n=1 Tax=Brassica oleracea var. oleracea TaxID=109376 RepID=UPI0006A748EE|nr:PREDICTED: protein RALF-like 30 [Brassica oleracea var. oleracea]